MDRTNLIPPSSALAQLLLIQNMAVLINDRSKVFELICAGLESLPGVSKATYVPELEVPQGELGPLVLPVQHNTLHYGYINLDGDPAKLKMFRPYINNVLVMIAVLLVKQDHEQKMTVERNQFFDLSHDLMCVAGNDGYFKTLNSQWSDKFGWDMEEFTSKPFVEFVHPDDLEKTMITFEKGKSGENICGFVNRYRKKDGEYIWLEWNSTYFGDYFYAVARDVSERLMAEKALAEKNAAEIANRAKSMFLANMSHELRTPLNAVIGFTQLLSDHPKFPPNDVQQEYLRYIEDAGTHLLSLINGILDISKIEANQIELQDDFVDVRKFSKECIEFLKNQADAKNISVLLNVNTPSDLHIHVDPIRLRQAVLNIISNAIKYSPPDKEVWVSVDDVPDQQICFSVKDFGYGIDEKLHDRVFDVFDRLNTEATRGVEGSGIGLPLTRAIIKAMGGEVSFTSHSGEGSTFCITLPMKLSHHST